MDKAEQLRLKLAELISDTMGKESGQLFYDFHKDDDADDVLDGARALLHELVGPKTADKKIEGVTKKL